MRRHDLWEGKFDEPFGHILNQFGQYLRIKFELLSTPLCPSASASLLLKQSIARKQTGAIRASALIYSFTSHPAHSPIPLFPLAAVPVEEAARGARVAHVPAAPQRLPVVVARQVFRTPLARPARRDEAQCFTRLSNRPRQARQRPRQARQRPRRTAQF